ncbi:MAG: ABC transporter ATP-binding protein [Alphaproteobacteria bacterium]|nr:ABC transporter ATP-binding protein [Alphaproteobacteria bacterium]
MAAATRGERAPAGLEAASLVKRFGGTAAVDGIDVAVRPGEFFTVLGPSGCGKTTFLRLVAGILSPDAGRIAIGGADVTRAPIWARRIGLVFQNYALFPHLTVAQNVAFGLAMQKVPRAERAPRVARALQTVRLEGYEKRKPAELSGGQQQRVALARAIVIEPDLLLLDEPLSNLDARLREDMRSELADLQRRVGITTVLVTHDIHEAFALSDRVAVMRSGKVEQIGAPTELYERPASRFVAGFLGPVNEWPGRVAALDGGTAEIAVDGLRPCRVAAGAGWRVGDAVALVLRPERVRLDPAGDDPAGPVGRIDQVAHLGNLVNYRIALADRAVLAQTAPGRTRALALGAAVAVAWDDADLAAVAS